MFDQVCPGRHHTTWMNPALWNHRMIEVPPPRDSRWMSVRRPAATAAQRLSGSCAEKDSDCVLLDHDVG